MPKKKKRWKFPNLLSKLKRNPKLPPIYITKEIIRGHLKNSLMELVHDKGYTVMFIFEMDAMSFENGKLVYGEASIFKNGKATIIFYIDNIMRAFLGSSNNTYLLLNKKNINKLKKLVDPIITEQIFALAGPIKGNENGKVN